MSQFQTIDVPAEILRAAGAGDQDAQEAIYVACQRPIYTLIRRIIPHAAIAEELFQDTLIQVLRNLDAYAGEGPFGAWVRSIAVNKCLMHLRSPWRRALLSLDAGGESSMTMLMDGASAPDAQAEASVQVERALAALPPLTRTVVWLHDVEGYTHSEIAHALGRTVSFSKSQLARAHVRLRELLDPQVESAPCTPVSTIC